MFPKSVAAFARHQPISEVLPIQQQIPACCSTYANNRRPLRIVCAQLRSRLSIPRTTAIRAQRRSDMQRPQLEPTTTPGNTIRKRRTCNINAQPPSILARLIPRNIVPQDHVPEQSSSQSAAPHAIIISHGLPPRRVHGPPELLPDVLGGKPFNSKQPYIGVHRHGSKKSLLLGLDECLHTRFASKRRCTGCSRRWSNANHIRQTRLSLYNAMS